MRRIVLRTALLLPVALCGCATRPATPELAPAVEVSPPVPEFPVIYESDSNQRLSSARLNEIRSTVDAIEADGAQIWFVYVSYSGEVTYLADVYLRPIVTAGRVHRGRVVHMNHNTPSAEYVQVVAECATANSRSTPLWRDFPFPPPNGVSDEDLPAIIDAARSKSESDAPVRGIAIEEDDLIRVNFNDMSFPLDHGGPTVDLKRVGSEFQIVGEGLWMRIH